jgi:hypothetical protein
MRLKLRNPRLVITFSLRSLGDVTVYFDSKGYVDVRPALGKALLAEYASMFDPLETTCDDSAMVAEEYPEPVPDEVFTPRVKVVQESPSKQPEFVIVADVVEGVAEEASEVEAYDVSSDPWNADLEKDVIALDGMESVAVIDPVQPYKRKKRKKSK